MAVRERTVPARRLGLSVPGDEAAPRTLAIEAPVALEYNGIGYAVMMATPTELRAYAIGFSLAEGLASDIADFIDISTHQADGGWIIRVTLADERVAQVIERARRRVSESSCGLCGIESIAQVLRPLPKVTAPIRTTRTAIAAALQALRDHQPLNRTTGAVHAAAFCTPDGAIVHACEDVGRHNALDKLVGRLTEAGIAPANGFILLSARCSYELVEKTVRAGCPLLVTISAATSLAVERATEAGLTLVCLAREDSALILNDPWESIR